VAYGERIVLHCPAGYKPALDQMVAAFVRDGVGFVAIVGKDAELVEDTVDELWVELTRGRGRTLITGRYSSIEDAVAMVQSVVDSFPGKVERVEL
jgi:hypothetical protein